jgi:hypothetical protein
MIKKKAKDKAAKKKTSTKKNQKKQLDPAEVRQQIAGMVKSGAKEITRAVIVHAKQGELAPAKYLLEMAGVYPLMTDGSTSTSDEDCLAKTLLHRLNLPEEPIQREEDDEPVTLMIPARSVVGTEPVSTENSGVKVEKPTDGPLT